jgi:hypothetical protein
LPHSHLLVQHLLKQLERHAATRDERDPRPAWLTDFVQRAAEHFAPFTGVGRVGYECELNEGGWEARLYLGNTEVVGGKDDGQQRGLSFELNLAGLVSCFTAVDDLRWNVAARQGEAGGSFLSLRGRVDDHALCVKAYSHAPRHAGPALRMSHDGQVQQVQAVE